VDAVQGAGAQRASGLAATDLGGEQLRARHDAGLLVRDRANCRRLGPDSGTDLRQLGHGANGRRPAVPTQHRFVTT
jgi:hypothetical protein